MVQGGNIAIEDSGFRIQNSTPNCSFINSRKKIECWKNHSLKSLVIIAMACIAFSFSNLQATYARPDTTSRPFFPVVLSDTKNFFSDAGTFFSSPLHFTTHDWLLTGATVGGAATLFLLDDEARSFARTNSSPFLDDISNVTRIYGESYFGVGLSAGIYGAGLFTKNKELRLTGLMVFESIAFSAAITHSLKVIIGRSRPYANKGNADYTPFSFPDAYVSLPSGHATAAFALSSVLSSKINNTYASIGLYSLATLTAFSRVYSDDHWISDIALGSVIGYVTGNAVLALHEDESSTSSLHIRPMLNGMRVELEF